MTYKHADLSILSYSSGFTLWHYRTGDSCYGMSQLGYFDAAAEMLRVGDMIMAHANGGDTPDGGIYMVVRNREKTVTVRNLVPSYAGEQK